MFVGKYATIIKISTLFSYKKIIIPLSIENFTLTNIYVSSKLNKQIFQEPLFYRANII